MPSAEIAANIHVDASNLEASLARMAADLAPDILRMAQLRPALNTTVCAQLSTAGEAVYLTARRDDDRDRMSVEVQIVRRGHEIRSFGEDIEVTVADIARAHYSLHEHLMRCISESMVIPSDMRRDEMYARMRALYTAGHVVYPDLGHVIHADFGGSTDWRSRAPTTDAERMAIAEASGAKLVFSESGHFRLQDGRRFNLHFLDCECPDWLTVQGIQLHFDADFISRRLERETIEPAPRPNIRLPFDHTIAPRPVEPPGDAERKNLELMRRGPVVNGLRDRLSSAARTLRAGGGPAPC